MPPPVSQQKPDYREKIEVEFEKNMEMPREQAKKLQEVVLNLNDKMGALLKREKDVRAATSQPVAVSVD